MGRSACCSSPPPSPGGPIEDLEFGTFGRLPRKSTTNSKFRPLGLNWDVFGTISSNTTKLFLVVSVSISENLVSDKNSRSQYRKFCIRKKVSVLISENLVSELVSENLVSDKKSVLVEILVSSHSAEKHSPTI